MSLVSTENMNLLLEVLTEGNTNKSSQNKLKSFVLNRTNYYHRNRLKYGSMRDVNKKIIAEGFNYMKQQQVSYNNPNDLSQIHSKKGNDFDLRLKEHETNFNTMINGNKPNEIDFSDNLEEEEAIPPNNMEYIVNQTLADREKELNRITTAYNVDEAKTSEWLNTKETSIKLNISESVPLNDVKNIKPKRVTFQDNPNNKSNNKSNNNSNNTIINSNVVEEIKSFIVEQKINDINNKILERLDIIEKNQRLLLKHFNLIKDNPTMSLS